MITIFEFKKIKVYSEKKFDFVDITKQAQDFVREFDPWRGRLDVSTQHTTTSIYLGEYEKYLLKDLWINTVGNFEIIAEFHNDIKKRRLNEPHLPENECQNTDSHLYSFCAGVAGTWIPVRDGTLNLGLHQSLCLVEFDDPKERIKAGKPEYREVVFCLMGKGKT